MYHGQLTRSLALIGSHLEIVLHHLTEWRHAGNPAAKFCHVCFLWDIKKLYQTKLALILGELLKVKIPGTMGLGLDIDLQF